MRTTPHLKLSYGGFSYDGGLELIAGNNLKLISDELTRLGQLAGFSSPAVFMTGPLINDGGQERAARENLLLIQAALTAIGTAADSVGSVVLQVGLDAVDTGRADTMIQNLLLIDAECERLAGILDGGGGGDVQNWLTGPATITVNLSDAAMPGQPGSPYSGSFGQPDSIMPGGSGTNTVVPGSRLYAAIVSSFENQGEMITNVILWFKDTTSGEDANETRLAGRGVTLRFNGAVIYTGELVALDVINLNAVLPVINWANPAVLVIEIAAP